MSGDYVSAWERRLKWCYLLGVVALLMVPVFFNLYISFNELGFGAARYQFTFAWYEAMFSDAQMLDALRWTGWLALATLVVVLPFGLASARLYKSLRNKIWLLCLMLLPLFVPADIFASSLLVFFKSANQLFGAIAELTGVAALASWFELGFITAVIGLVIYTLPYVFVVILITMGRYATEQTDAARACGATPWQAFWQVEFPQIRAGVFSAGAFTIILVFNEYVRSNALKGGFDTFTTVLVSQMLNTGMSEQSYAMGGLISVVAIAVIGTIIAWTLLRADREVRRQQALQAQGTPA